MKTSTVTDSEVLKNTGVADSSLSVQLNQFATLASRVNLSGVITKALDNHTMHTCHIEKTDGTGIPPSYSSKQEEEIILEWLSIVFDEGHIEPSQPKVGRVLGWPCRPFAISSLWVDFSCWFQKEQLPQVYFPAEEQFHELLAQLFNRKGDKYHFHPLAEYRQIFLIWRKNVA
jgi:hypothetical protein